MATIEVPLEDWMATRQSIVQIEERAASIAVTIGDVAHRLDDLADRTAELGHHLLSEEIRTEARRLARR